ncbi:MAG: conjugal transfer protein TraG N-terminal domain-containing protein, partial [Mariprofundaceae bacterium]
MALVTHEVYTYGGGEALYEVFNAVAALMGGSDYLTLVRTFAVLGLFWVVIEMGVLRKTINWHWFVMFMLMFNIFFVPKWNITIVDRLNPAATRTVANVPFGLAGPAWLTSTLGDGLTRLVESNFTTPNDLKYSRTGMIFGSKLAISINNAQFDDPQLTRNLNEYARQCIYMNIAYGFYSFKDVYYSPDLLNLLFSPTRNSNIRGIFYDPGNGNARFLTCRQAAAQLRADMTPVVNGMVDKFAAALFGNTGLPKAQLKAKLLTALPVTYAYLGNLTTTASQQVTQAAIANYFLNSYGHVAAMAGANAAAQAWSVAVAERQRKNAMRTMGEIAGRALPIMQTVFQVIIYATFFLVFLALMLPITVSGKALMTWIKMLLWLQLWPILYAVLNLTVTVYGKMETTSMAANFASMASMAGMAGMADIHSDMVIIAG